MGQSSSGRTGTCPTGSQRREKQQLTAYRRPEQSFGRPAAIGICAALVAHARGRLAPSLAERAAPVPVPAVTVVHVAARTACRVASGQRKSGRLIGQESCSPEPLGQVASIAAIAQADAVVDVSAAATFRRKRQTPRMPPCPAAPPQREHNQRCDDNEGLYDHRLKPPSWPLSRGGEFVCPDTETGRSLHQYLQLWAPQSIGHFLRTAP